jgi:hypothetical protein
MASHARLASTIKISLRDGSLLEQSANLPGKLDISNADLRRVSEVRQIVDKLFSELFERFLYEHPQVGRIVVEKGTTIKISLRDGSLLEQSANLPGKLDISNADLRRVNVKSLINYSLSYLSVSYMNILK